MQFLSRYSLINLILIIRYIIADFVGISLCIRYDPKDAEVSLHHPLLVCSPEQEVWVLDPGPDFAGQPGGDLPGEQKPTHEQYGRSKGTWAVCKGKTF